MSSEEIEKMYVEYNSKMNELRQEQNGIINAFILNLEKKKKEEVLGRLKN